MLIGSRSVCYQKVTSKDHEFNTLMEWVRDYKSYDHYVYRTQK